MSRPLPTSLTHPIIYPLLQPKQTSFSLYLDSCCFTRGLSMCWFLTFLTLCMQISSTHFSGPSLNATPPGNLPWPPLCPSSPTLTSTSLGSMLLLCFIRDCVLPAPPPRALAQFIVITYLIFCFLHWKVDSSRVGISFYLLYYWHDTSLSADKPQCSYSFAQKTSFSNRGREEERSYIFEIEFFLWNFRYISK